MLLFIFHHFSSVLNASYVLSLSTILCHISRARRADFKMGEGGGGGGGGYSEHESVSHLGQGAQGMPPPGKVLNVSRLIWAEML